MSGSETRAEGLGIKPAQLRRATLARIKRVRAAAGEIAGLWGDVDQAMVNVAEELERRADELVLELDESIKLLGQTWDEQ